MSEHAPETVASARRPRALSRTRAAVWAIGAAAAGLVFWASSGMAVADETAVRSAVYTDQGDGSYVRSVGYSEGASGRRLTWLPVRPTKEEVARASAPMVAQYTSPAAGEPFLPDLPNAFNDPFGDTGQMGQLEPPHLEDTQLPGDDLLEKPTLPPLAEPMPQIPDVGPMPRAESSRKSEEIESLEEALAAGPGVEEGECPTPDSLKKISEITQEITPKEGRFPHECGLGNAAFIPRAWEPTTFTWKASALCHKPLYFEAVHVERYGHSWGPYLQPIISGAHFFLNVPLLPYNMGLYPPGECMYSLGYYRPGNCAPYLLDPLPISVRAAVAEGGVWTGLVAAIP